MSPDGCGTECSFNVGVSAWARPAGSLHGPDCLDRCRRQPAPGAGRIGMREKQGRCARHHPKARRQTQIWKILGFPEEILVYKRKSAPFFRARFWTSPSHFLCRYPHRENISLPNCLERQSRRPPCRRSSRSPAPRPGLPGKPRGPGKAASSFALTPGRWRVERIRFS